jgi:hypothetical protein
MSRTIGIRVEPPAKQHGVDLVAGESLAASSTDRVRAGSGARGPSSAPRRLAGDLKAQILPLKSWKMLTLGRRVRLIFAETHFWRRSW